MKHRLIDTQRRNYPVKRLCQVLNVSRSGYYAARNRPVSARRKRQWSLTALIQHIHHQSPNVWIATCTR